MRTTTSGISTGDAPRPSGPAGDGRVLFVSGTGGRSMRYRCEYKAEQLRLAGTHADVVLERDVDLAKLVKDYRLFVLHRVPWRARFAEFLRLARRRGATVVYDADDFVFDREAAALLAWRNQAVEVRERKFDRQRRMLAVCDGVTVSTQPLVDLARRHHACVALAPNVVGQELVSAVARTARVVRERSDPVTIGYFSGSPSHDRDFLEAAPALEWALDRFRQVRLLIVGPLDLGPRFDRFAERVERLAFLPAERLPELLARTDVNVAPLEPGNAFTAAKSCIKYLEAGVAGVPTIASTQPDYVRAIRHGDNGMLAAGEPEWRDALERVLHDREARLQMGRRAREDVLASHTTRAAAGSYASTLADLVSSVRQPRVQRELRALRDFEARGRAAVTRRVRARLVKKP